MSFKTSVIALGLTFSLVGPSFAQDDYVWPLCADLDPMIAAAKEPTPFLNFSERTRNGDSFGVVDGYASLDMEANSKCRVYIAGTTEGIRGGGKYNYLECTVFRPFGDETIRDDELKAKRQYYAGILGTCSALSSWRFALPENPKYRLVEEGWTDPETGTEVLIATEDSPGVCKRRGCTPNPNQEVNFVVRAKNPSYTPPAPVQ